MRHAIKINSTKVRTFAELLISILVLPFFLIKTLFPFHLFDFLGGGIVTVSMIHNSWICLKLLFNKKPYQDLPSQKVATMKWFLAWYVTPTYLGLSFIYLSDYITDPNYSHALFLKDLFILNSTTLVIILIQLILTLRRSSTDS